MSAEVGYPDFFDGTFNDVVDIYRCHAESNGRRCQLYARHTDPHAHAWLEPRTGHTHRSRAYPWHPHVIRWVDGADPAEVAEPGRLRWCCMFRP